MEWQFPIAIAGVLAIISLLVLGLEAVCKLSAIAEDTEAIRGMIETEDVLSKVIERMASGQRAGHHLDE